MVIAGNRERLGVVPEGSPLLLGLSSWGMECPVGLSVARAWFPLLPGCLRGAEQQKSRRLRAHPCLRLPLAAAPSSSLPAPGEWSRGWAARRSAPVSAVLPALLPGCTRVFWGQSCGSLLLACSVPTQAGPVCVEWTGVGWMQSLCCVLGP